MISRHEASVGQAPVERERNLMRPDGERERERGRGGGRRGEKCTRPNRAGYRCISDDAFQEFRARSTLEEFFFPSFPPSATSAASPHSSRSLARSPGLGSNQNNVPTPHRRTPLLRYSSLRIDEINSRANYSILFAILLASGET